MKYQKINKDIKKEILNKINLIRDKKYMDSAYSILYDCVYENYVLLTTDGYYTCVEDLEEEELEILKEKLKKQSIQGF